MTFVGIASREKRTCERDLRVAVSWPARRLDRIERALSDSSLYEQMDGLSYLRDSGVSVSVIDSSEGWLNPLAGRGSLLAGIDPFRFLHQLQRYREYDVLIGIDSSAVFLFVQLKRLLRLKKPVIVIDPALDPTYRNRMRLHRHVLPHVSLVVVYGRVQLEFLAREFGHRVRATFTPHRIDCRFFDPRKASRRVQDPARRFIVAVGNDVGRDYAALVEAVRDTEVSVVIHTRQSLKDAIPSNVRIQSTWVPYEELRDLYNQAAIVVVPLKETLHASGINGLLEALAMGRPVVVSGSRGIIDYVQDGRTALVTPPGDVLALRQAILRLWHDEDLALQLGRNAEAHVREHFDIPVYAQQIAELIAKVSLGHR
jgi:glycosyltransferase involved in cell wall biosynthesis